MGWSESEYKADTGKFQTLKNVHIDGTAYSKGIINNYVVILSTGNTAEEAPGPDLFVSDMSGSFGITEIEQGQTVNLFGFELKQNNEPTGKYAVCRCEGTVISNTPGNMQRYYQIKWQLYDKNNNTYTDLANYIIDAGFGTVGSIHWNNIDCYCCFKIAKETWWGETQTMLYGGILTYSNDSDYGHQWVGKTISMQGIGCVKHLSDYDEPDITEIEFSPEYGMESESGGYTGGSFDDTSDIISIDSKPSVGVTTAGFINVYKITQGDLNTLGEKLFPHFLPAELLADPSSLSTPEMLAVVLKSFFGTLISPVGSAVQLADNLGVIDILMNGKLIDYVIDCHIIPCSISGATVEGLKVGYRQFNDLQLARATEDYVDVDCGSLSIREYFANFLDFCTCTAELYLPFVGFVPIDSEYWNGGTIQVKYRFNIIDGSFQAFVLATSGKSNLSQSIIAQYGGVACVHLPITGLQYSNVIAGLVNGSAGAVASASGSNPAGVVSNLANMAMLKPNNPMSNGYNASSGFLGKRTPYLLIKRPKAQFSKNYPKEIGLPLNVTKTLSSLRGLTICSNVRINFACTEDESREIESALKEGVIL